MFNVKELLLTPQQAAEVLGLPLRGIHRILSGYKVPKYMVGKHARYKFSDVEECGRQLRKRLAAYNKFVRENAYLEHREKV